ncbi:unnamed protein product [Macrosiphum euphorbiae]|uniref:Lethal(3)malignant brain tumor-like protein 3 n=1 Tax=Macrosiphum euphorbiae TaxID=13131 RepID=A0AAV0VXT0_9HEMI|nr:unnamed protein product [Macrosiphum euphorbiae]
MPIPEDQITERDDSEDDSDSDSKIIEPSMRLNKNIMYGATNNSNLIKRLKENISLNVRTFKTASTATVNLPVNLEHSHKNNNRIPAGCSSLKSNASSSHRLKSIVKKKHKSSLPKSVQLSSNSESLKQSNSLQLSHTAVETRGSQNLKILREVEKPSNKYKVNYLIAQSDSSDKDDTSKKFISCKYENCGKLMEEPELLIDNLFCSLACKNQKQTVTEEHFVDETSNPTEKTTVDRNHILTKFKNRTNKKKLTKFKNRINKKKLTKLKNRINKKKQMLKTSCPEENDNSNEQPLIEDNDVLKYMTGFQLRSAPLQFFDRPFPTEKNLFVVGEKLEGIDPKYEALFCVMTVTEVCGYRIKLNFDGYGSEHDFWVNADCPDLFYAGWCKMNSRILQPPYNYGKVFDWTVYLRECQAVPAPKCNFISTKNLGSCAIPHKFRIGGKLEALDKLTRTQTKQLIYVATVADILGNRVRIHFDGWSEDFDYWADITSTYIHPIGWCEKNGRTLIPPEYDTAKKGRKPFKWTEYLAETNSEPVPEDAFVRRPLRDFSNEMIIEVFDCVVPRLLRIAKVVDVRGDELKIVYDGFDDDYAYWIEDDGPNIHPVGWSSKINHPIELPPASNTLWSCNIHGCRGYGNSSNHLKTDHVEIKDCPYEMDAWKNALAGLSNVPYRLKPLNIELPQHSKSSNK